MLERIVSYLAEHDAITTFYVENLRSSLFSGFITLAGFLFTVKSFLITRLQQDVYGDPDYQDWIVDVGQKYSSTLTVYGSLKRLGRFLFATLCVSFVAAVCQLTIGLLGQRWATWLALTLAATAAVMFAATLFIVRSSIRAWVEYLEQKADKRQRERREARANAP